MTSCTGSVRGGFGGFEKSQLVEFSLRRRRRLTFGAPRYQTSSLRRGAVRGGEQMEKSASKDCLSLSLCRITFNSKVLKSFVPELRSRKCFLWFGIPMLSIYELWTFYEHFTYSCMAMLHYYSSVWTWKRWQWRNTPHFHNFQHYWSLTIGLFWVISRTLIGGVLPLESNAIIVFCRPSRVGQMMVRDGAIPIFQSFVQFNLILVMANFNVFFRF